MRLDHPHMKYRLVLQFFGESIGDYDVLIAFETRLIEALGPTHAVDGHDFGSGKMNIFVDSNDPEGALWIARGIVRSGPDRSATP